MLRRAIFLLAFPFAIAISSSLHAQSAPTCTLSKDSEGGGNVAVTATCSDRTGLSGITIDWHDGKPADFKQFSNNETSGSFSSIRGLTDGQHSITAFGTNTQGTNGPVAILTVTVDRTASCSIAVDSQQDLSVTLTATCSSQNGVGEIFLDWGDQSKGDAQVFPGPPTTASAKFSHTYAASGRYTATATERDGSEQETAKTMQTLIVPNQAPFCEAIVTPSTGAALTQNFTTRGSCDDSNKDIVTITLDWGDGSTPDTFNPDPNPASYPIDISNFTHRYSNAGTYQFSVSATDTANNTSTTKPQTITVTPNARPVCTFSVTPPAGTVPLAVTASGQCTDAENDLGSGRINWGDGTAETFVFGTKGTTASSQFSGIAHTYQKTGNYTATLRAFEFFPSTDTDRETDFTQNVVVSAVNTAPTCSVSVKPTSGTAFNTSFTATANCNDAEADINKISIDWGDSSSPASTTVATPNTTPPSFSASHIYQNTATTTFTITATASDTGGLSGSAQTSVTVNQNQPPSCTLTLDKNNGTAPLTVNATASCRDTDDNVNTASLDWGDGSTPQSLNCDGSCSFRGPHTYTAAGTYTLVVSGTDSGGLKGSASQTVTVTAPADSTPKCTLTPDKSGGQAPLTVTFSGSCTDAGNDVGEGGSATLDFGDNTPPQQISTLNGGNFSNVSHTYQNAGSFTATYTVTDFHQNTAKATATITATAPQAPSCTLSLDKNAGPPGTTISATGSCTETTNNGGFGTVSIDFGDGSAPSTITGDGQSTLSLTASHQYNTPGNFTVTVTGTDNGGQKNTATKPVTITQNSTPTCGALNATPNSGNAPLSVTVTATCSDANKDLTSSVLDFGDGQVVNNTLDGQSQTISANTQHTYTAPGTFTVVFTATDAQGLKGTTSNTVTVTSPPPPNLPPTCTLTAEAGTGLASLKVTATGNCTDPENDIVSTSLDFGDGTVQTATSGDHTYAKPGTYTITVSATDQGGLKGSASQTVTLSAVNTAPTCTLVVAPTSGTVPLAVTATGSCTDAENNITTTVLDFGDGPVTNGSSGTHTYTVANVYTVKLTATDAGGLTGSATQTVTATLSAFPVGVFLGITPGTLNRYGTDGKLLKSVSTGLGGTVAGMAFDKAGNIYAADFTAGNISKFDDSGNLLGTFGSGYNCQPESLVFDGAGNLYVGQQGCSRAILKFDPSGKLLDQFTVKAEEQGSDDIDLSADQCTMLYTSEGPSILRYDVCKKQQLSPFATGLKKALVPRILPDGGVIVTDLVDILRLDSSGKTITTYNAPGEQCWYPVTLDQDGKTFWAADYCSSNIYQFDIASGKQLGKFSSGTASGSIFGIARAGTGLNVAGMGSGGSMTASPPTATVAAGKSASFTVTFTVNQSAVGQTFQLSCAGLPPGFSCAFSPASITPTSTAPVTATMTLSSTATHASLHPSSAWAFASWLALFPAVVLAGVPLGNGKRKRKAGSLLALMFVAMATFTAASCGGNNQMTKTVTAAPQGSYNVIVTGHSSQSQASTTVNVTVQ